MNYVDLYCERLAPGLWSEPVNALTNGAFLIASGVLIWLLARQRAPLSVWLPAVMTGVVGLCSLAFHTVATGFTGLLDSVSIGVFILITVVVAVHQVWALPWRWAWLAAPGFVAVVLAVTAVGVRSALGAYLAALLTLLGFGVAIRWAAPREMRRFGSLLLWAAALFAVSLTLRTIDGSVCEAFPVGTHFLWHCLNATVLFLTSFTVIRCWQAAPAARNRTSSPATTPGREPPEDERRTAGT